MAKVCSRGVARVGLGLIALLALAGGACSESETTRVPRDVATSGPRTLLVGFSKSTSTAKLQAAVGRHGGYLVQRSNALDVALVSFPDETSARAAATALTADRLITSVQENAACGGAGVGPSPLLDPALLRRQWNLPAMGLPPLGWAFLNTAPSVTVAVLDTGVAYEDYDVYRRAPVLAGVTFVPGYDFVNRDDHPNDDHQHGTHVASVIAAARAFRPVAPRVRLMAVKVLDDQNRGSELTLAEGIVYATQHGAKVINMSLAFPPGYIPGRVLNQAVDYAAAHGVVMVAAAGNHGGDVVTYPAAFREVIAVGASKLRSARDLEKRWWSNADRHLEPADYSNLGARIDVLAPGGMVDEDLDGDGQPEAILGQTFEPGHFDRFRYWSAAGTSQAAAEVSGLAALMLDDNPRLKPYDLRALLGETAELRGSGPLDDQLGRGFVEASHALLGNLWERFSRRQRPIFFANVAVTLHDGPGGLKARATVEVLDAKQRPAAKVRVSGSFAGGGISAVEGETNNDGIVRFTVALPATTHITAFQVDAIATKRGSRYGETVDRPRGIIRIGAGSLDLLSQFGRHLMAQGQGVGPSPLLVSYAPSAVGNDPTYRQTLNLLNWSWSLATVPMTVAADEAWYASVFPDTFARRAITSQLGVGPSPLRFTSTSFPVALSTTLNDRLAFLLATYVSGNDADPLADLHAVLGVGASPLIPDLYNSPDWFPGGPGGGNNDDKRDDFIRATDLMWANAMGVGPSPLFDPRLFPVLRPIEFVGLQTLVSSYVPFGLSDEARPVLELPEVLSAAGVTLVTSPASAVGLGSGFSLLPP